MTVGWIVGRVVITAAIFGFQWWLLNVLMYAPSADSDDLHVSATVSLFHSALTVYALGFWGLL